jgi:hypothetical protein
MSASPQLTIAVAPAGFATPVLAPSLRIEFAHRMPVGNHLFAGSPPSALLGSFPKIKTRPFPICPLM